MMRTFRWILLGGSLLLSGASISARPPMPEARVLPRHAYAWAPAAKPTIRGSHEEVPVRTAPGVTVHDVNPGAVVERDLCLTVAMGAGAAAECGDLRLVHALPTVRTLNRARTPVLLYNSQHARPYALVAAHVTLPQGTSALQRVTATLWVDDRPRARSTWNGSHWPGSGPARIALGYDAQSEATAVKRFVLEVAAVYASASGEVADTTRAVGALTIINRKNSPFGPGWWLAGLEQLLLDSQGNPEIWVGGDGSVRRYAAVPGEAGRWAAPEVDRPDTLVREGSDFVRLLPGGVRVRFDARGRHVATINRLGHQTTLGYTPDGRLDTLKIPPTGAGLSYAFVYAADGRLGRVDAPGAHGPSGPPRSVVLTRSGAQLTIMDPDSNRVVFTHVDGTGRRIVSRTDRRGHTTYYRYDTAGKLSASRLDLENGDSIVTRLRALESMGLAASDGTGAVDTAQAYTRLDGPRDNVTDAADTTLFWLDRFGAPRRIRNALGHETVMSRENPTYPALVTRVEHPVLKDGRRRVQTARYDARGNLESQTDLSVERTCNGRSGNPVVRYQWNQQWDFVEQIEMPCGEVTTFDYDEEGNRRWQQSGTSPDRQVRFEYHPANHAQAPGLLSAVLTPAPANDGSFVRETIEYDALGNLSATRTPLGVYTLYVKDQLGRDTLIVSPTDDEPYAYDRTQLWSSSKAVMQRMEYDLLDRDTLSVHSGPATTYTDGDGIERQAEAQSVTVRKVYDDEGNLESLTRSTEPNPAHPALTTRWRYDAAGRKIAETATDGREEIFLYDPAGNLKTWLTRRHSFITMEYDALNRLKTRRIPAASLPGSSHAVQEKGTDTYWYFPMFLPDANEKFEVRNTNASGLTIPESIESFGYDAMGNLEFARNGDAQVERTYYLDGLLETETQRIRNYGTNDFSTHQYVLGYSYDMNGRRTELVHPQNIAPVNAATGAPAGTVLYAYDATGALEKITDGFKNEYRFEYDFGGRLRNLRLPGRIVEQPRFDDDGQQTSRVVRRYDGLYPDGIPNESEWLISDQLAHDARGKLTHAQTRVDTAENRYSGLGALLWARSRRTDDRKVHTEIFDNDGLGNARTIKRASADPTVAYPPFVTTALGYNDLGQQNTEAHSEPGSTLTDQKFTLGYDASGNKESYIGLKRISFEGAMGNELEHTQLYYDAAERLRVVDRRTCNLFADGCDPERPPPHSSRSTFEEYRYDALGRRVLVRTRQEYGCDPEQSPCVRALTRTVWDGDQILYELRYRGHTGAAAEEMEQDTGRVQNGEQEYETMDENGQLVSIYTVTDGPLFGRVAYLHGPGIDQPLSITRMDYSVHWQEPETVVPVASWRGVYLTGVWGDGSQEKCKQVRALSIVATDTVNWVKDCMEVPWPEADVGMFYKLRGKNVLGSRSWMGSLIDGKRDASGQMYMRNRYYDPSTGRFTQEDPIGLAGGLNLYGFANGDPVGYSDPYGLCPPEDDNYTDCATTILGALGGLIGGVAGGFGGGAGGLALCSPGGFVAFGCAAGGGLAGAAAGAGKGAAIGASAGALIDVSIAAMSRAGRGGGNSAENRGSNHFIKKHKLNSSGRQEFHRELGRLKKAGEKITDEVMDDVASQIAEHKKWVK